MNSRLPITLAAIGLALSASLASAQSRPERDGPAMRDGPAQQDRADRRDRESDGRVRGPDNMRDRPGPRDGQGPRDSHAMRDGPGRRGEQAAPFQHGDGQRKFAKRDRAHGPRQDVGGRRGDMVQRFRQLPPDIQRKIMKRVHERMQHRLAQGRGFDQRGDGMRLHGQGRPGPGQFRGPQHGQFRDGPGGGPDGFGPGRFGRGGPDARPDGGPGDRQEMRRERGPDRPDGGPEDRPMPRRPRPE